jgi:hypothetical protein
MARIPAGYSDLVRAFRKHVQEMGSCNDGPSKHLLFFYAIECGLKHFLVKRSHCLRTDQLNEDHGHNLRGMLKTLKAPRSVIGDIPEHFRVQGYNQNCYAMGEAHQAWRYGVRIERQDEIALIQCLGQIKKWIERSL